ncbi:MAG: hypothetical protein KatS3mg076_0308 [Candidatus Binatia bacterium]|nr:MAG: hypothetical protein KatS3mg076_0308 [Candidatus Binatia bacterium]
MAPPRVALVLLNWNGKQDILRALASLPRLRYPNWTATVVDNASTDGSVEAIRERFPAQRVLVMEKNLGFCGGNNRGIEDALRQGADYVLLLNNDIEVHEDLLDELVATAETDPGIGAVGAKNLVLDQPELVWGAYGMVTFRWSFVELHGYRQPDGAEWSQVKDVDWVIGNGMMLRREAVERVGGFDENLFGYHEDVDWCIRARRAGFRVVYNGRAVVYHRGFGASGPDAKMPFPTMYFLGRNAYLVARKHGSPAELRGFVVRFLAEIGRQAGLALVRGDRVKPYLWLLRGFADGLRNRLPLRELRLQ